MKKLLAIILFAVIMFSAFTSVSFAESNSETKNPVSENYLIEECPVHGSVVMEQFQEKSGNDNILIWTPYNYDESVKYNVILLLHGGGGNLHDWIDAKHYVDHKEGVVLSNLYDWMSLLGKTDPFIVCAINNRYYDRRKTCEEAIKAMSYMAEHYGTYAASGNIDDIVAAKDHFAIGGLSQGSYSTWCFIAEYSEYCGNYICLSGGIAKEFSLDVEKISEIDGIFAACGTNDGNYRWTGRCLETVQDLADKSMFVTYKNGEHNWSVWYKGIYDAINFLFKKNFPLTKMRDEKNGLITLYTE